MIEHDNITGLPAYSHFEFDAKKLLKNALPNEYMILSLNADNFRIINDTYGILCGNEILKLLGKHFASQCGKTNSCAVFMQTTLFSL